MTAALAEPEDPIALSRNGTGAVPLAATARAGILGNLADQVHIFLPVLALAPALPRLVGADAMSASGGLVVVALFLGRPVGAVLFGRVADRVGRTATTQVAIAGTAACSLAVACLPGHEVLGPMTFVLLVALRFLGGVFLAGEYTAAVPLAMEWTPARLRGLLSGSIMAMAPLAQSLIGLWAFAAVGLLGPDAYARGGWRAAFVVGSLASLAMLALYRRRVRDAVEPTRSPRAGSLREVVTGASAPTFWALFGLMSGLWCLTTATVLVLSARVTTNAALPPRVAGLALAGAGLVQAVAMVGAGALSTRWGRARTVAAWGALGLVAGPPLWLLAVGATTPVRLALAAGALQAVTVAAYGPMGAWLAESFPAARRSSGYGAAYSLSIVVPALHPFYLGSLSAVLGRNGAGLAMLVVGALLVLGCALLAGRLERR